MMELGLFCPACHRNLVAVQPPKQYEPLFCPWCQHYIVGRGHGDIWAGGGATGYARWQQRAARASAWRP